MSEQTLSLGSFVVHQWHCDHFGHMNVRHYAGMFDDATFLFWGQLGFTAPASGETGVVPVTAEVKTSFLSEAVVGSIVTIQALIIRVGSKSVALRFEMHEARTRDLLATCEAIEVFFDTRSRTSHTIPQAIRDRLENT
ncbi:acyl-CoA thioesterase [Pseudomonas sp. LRF_L74]|uniref:acyl-CoA thioesterase n=1 Tax=Pseudomonas sp. LRF_L74 TaxID=3369422 RepID=UPI003F62C58B